MPFATKQFFNSWKKIGRHIAHQRNLRVKFYIWHCFDHNQSASWRWLPSSSLSWSSGRRCKEQRPSLHVGKLGITTFAKVPKLLQTLHPKESYVLQYCTLEFYHELKMKIIHLGKSLQFRQSQGMAPFVDLINQLQKTAASEFQEKL